MLKNLNKLSNFIPIHSSLRSLLNVHVCVNLYIYMYVYISTKSYLTHLGDFAFLVNKRRRKRAKMGKSILKWGVRGLTRLID
ncbi:hypothetical protein BOH78_2666 [Pichia kudriavzevii]|uniref:Uncharacterized protein n=1 Tax=Pichia kudriavzevii TaxID=4909 RepID=A0A1V2LNL9_PICKU|nr:hypothetical protein BOH78_2666 [Pichia kudriavzevii]